MWRNYLTVGFRALTRSRTYAFINIFGLALGTIAGHAIRVARSNPIHALRYE